MAENHCPSTNLPTSFEPEQSAVAKPLITREVLCQLRQGADEAGLFAMSIHFEALLPCARRLPLFLCHSIPLNVIASDPDEGFFSTYCS